MSASRTPLVVLIVEDSRDDADLIVLQLEKAGFAVSHERVASAQQMRAALRNRSWDIVLSDFNLPGFGAGEALATLRETGSDVPFIVVSGLIDEASAVELMRAGAQDYLMKSDLARLAPAVKREIAEARVRQKRRRAEADLARHVEQVERARRALLSVLEDQRHAQLELQQQAEDLRAEIGEREKAQAALGESERRFRLLIEKSLAGMYVSRDGRFLYANPRLEEILGYGPGEMIGLRADDLVLPDDLPLMNAARDQLRAGASSATYSVRVRRKNGALIELGVQGIVTEIEGELATIGMAQDIGERNRAQAEIKRYIARLERTTQGTLEAVSLMVELRDPYTAGHEHRVGELAAAIGAEMGLSEETVKGLRLAGYVHDIGKISVPAELLAKPSRLTPIEFELIKAHAQAGFDVLKDVDFPWPIAQVILQHHERLDGSGYPRQLKDGEIILEARVMAVADVVEAMSSHRPYRPGLGVDAALGEIEKNSGKIYDARAAAACLRLFREKGYVLPE